MVWSNFTEPLGTGRLPREDRLVEPSSGRITAFPWQSNAGLRPSSCGCMGCTVKRSCALPCKGFNGIPPQETPSVPEARLWPDTWCLMPLLSRRVHRLWYGPPAAEPPQETFVVG